MDFTKEIQEMVYWHLVIHWWKYSLGLTVAALLVVVVVAVVI